MAAIYSDNINYVGNKPNFERDRVKTLAQLLAEDPAKRRYPFGHIVFCEEDNNHYKFNYNYENPGSTQRDDSTGWFEKVVKLILSQTTGNNTGAVMSQAATTAEFEKTKNKVSAHSTVRFDRIEEGEITVITGIPTSVKEVVYHKPSNVFVAYDGSAYWVTWDGMEAYMKSGTARKDKVYLCGDKAYTVQNTANPYVGAVYALRDINAVEDLKALARQYNYTGDYPFSNLAIEAGADKMVIAGYVDLPYEDGMAYMLCDLRPDISSVGFKKKPKGVKADSNSVVSIGYLSVKKIENSPYYMAKGKKDVMGDTWFILDWAAVEQKAVYDYDGCELAPALFKGNGLSSKIEEVLHEISAQGNSTISISRINDNSITAAKLRNPIFVGDSQYATSIKELYILPEYRVDGEYKYKVYDGKSYVRPYPVGSSTFIYNCSLPLPTDYDGSPIPISIVASNDARYPIGHTVGYIVYNEGYISDNLDTGSGDELNTYQITVEGYSPRISQFLKDNAPVEDEEDKDVDYSYLISIPATFDVVAGDTLQIFKRSVVRAYNPYLYDVEFTGDVGKDYPRYFSYKSTASEAGKTHRIKVVVRNDKGDIICEKNTQINVIKSVASSAKKILMMGASSMASGHISKEIQRRITGTDGESGNPANPKGLGLDAQFVGRTIAQGVNQEATGGWSWNMYNDTSTAAYRFYVSGVSQLNMGDSYNSGGLTFTIAEINVTDGTGNIRCTYTGIGTPAASGVLTRSSGTGDESITYESCEKENPNPFFNKGKLDFKKYADTYCGGSIDIIMAHCGVNDAWSSRTAKDVVKDIKEFAHDFNEAFPNGKFVLSTLPLPDCTGGMAANYGCNHHYYTKALRFWEYAEAFNALADEVDYIYASQVLPTFDCEYGYPKTATSVNNRASETEQLGTNGVHPTADGSKLVADAIYATLNKVL